MFGLEAIIPVLGQLIQLFPNAEQRERATTVLRDFELEIAKGQLEVNKVEAGNASLFVSGWRPCVGWVCCAGFLYTVVQPIFHLPATDLNIVISTLGGLLGLGSMRTAEKIAGVTR